MKMKNEKFVNDGTWELLGDFGNCLIYGKGKDRILVNIETKIITFEYKDTF